MANHPENKYHLKDVHQEIDYLDRKIAYAQTLEQFASEAEREAAIKKLRLKRDPLAAAARDLAGKGVEWQAKDLPRSFTQPAAADGEGEPEPSDSK